MKRLFDQGKLNNIRDGVEKDADARGPPNTDEETKFRSRIKAIIERSRSIPGKNRIEFMGSDKQEWEELTKNGDADKFWADIARRVGINVDELDEASITNIMDFNWFWEVMESDGLLMEESSVRLDGLLEALRKYVKYYDPEISLPFMLIYMRFLMIRQNEAVGPLKKKLLVPYGNTKHHVAVSKPIPSTPIVNNNNSPKPVSDVPEKKEGPPIEVKKEPVTKPVVVVENKNQPAPKKTIPVVEKKKPLSDEPESPFAPSRKSATVKPVVVDNKKKVEEAPNKSAPSDAAPSLVFMSDNIEYDFMSTLLYDIPKKDRFAYKFYTKAAEVEKKLYIEKEGKKVAIATKGSITRVLKFVYHGFIVLIASGVLDKMYIRFRYDLFEPEYFLVINNYTLDGEWDDISYAVKGGSPRFVLPINAIDDVRARKDHSFAVLDLAELIKLRPLMSQSGDYKDVKTMGQYDISDNRKLTGQEAEILVSYQRDVDSNFDAAWEANVQSEGVAFRDYWKQYWMSNTIDELELNHLEALKRATSSIDFAPIGQTKHADVFTVFKLPFPTILFVNEPTQMKQGNRILVALKIITVPAAETGDTQFHLACLTRFVNGKTGQLTFKLCISFSLYEKDREGAYKTNKYTMMDLEKLSPPTVRHTLLDRDERDNATQSVKDFNVIFHNTAWCHVELTTISNASNMTNIANSRIFYFDRQYGMKDLATNDYNSGIQLPIKDKAFFEMMARNHYKLYDYRHHPRAHTLFHAIFVKYYPNDKDKSPIRFVVYKAQGDADVTGEPPLVAVARVSPRIPGDTSARVDIISPVHTHEKLFFFSFVGRTPKPLVRVSFNHGNNFVKYNAETMDLASALQKSLSLGATFEKEGDSMCVEGAKSMHCVLCGDMESEHAFEDTKDGKIYCDEVCQYIFRQTRAM